MNQKRVSTNNAPSPTISRMAVTLRKETTSYSSKERFALLNQLALLAFDDAANTIKYAYDKTALVTMKNAKENNEINDAQYKALKKRANQLAKLLHSTETSLSTSQQKQIIVFTFQLWKNNLAGLPTAEGIATPNILDAFEKIIAFLGNKTPVDQLQFCKDLAILCANMKQANLIHFISEATTLLPVLWIGIEQQSDVLYENLKAIFQNAIFIVIQELANQHLKTITAPQEKQFVRNRVTPTEKKTIPIAKGISTLPEKICPTAGISLTRIIEKITVSKNNYTNLNLAYIAYTNLEIQTLATALMHKNCMLTNLSFIKNNISDTATEFLSEALTHPNCKLTSLTLKFNNIRDTGTQALAEALKHKNCKLTALALSCDEISDVACKALADSLKHENCKLTFLDLGYNELTNVAVQALANSLKHENCKLTFLDLSWNNFSTIAVQALADSMKDKNSKLFKLILYYNEINNIAVHILTRALIHKNCKLMEISVTIPNSEIETFETALKHPTCKILKYEGNFSPDDQLKQIFEQRKLAYEKYKS